MDLLKAVRRRSVVSELIYSFLNVALAVTVVLVIKSTESLVFAVLIVLLSKWRIFAVRPRYWMAHLQANLVDTITSVAFVILMYTVVMSSVSSLEQSIVLAGLTLLYIVWLLVIKPRSSRLFMQIQAAVAVFLGTTALFAISYDWPGLLVVMFMWIIGYGTARHSFASYEEENTEFFSLTWGLIFAELGWLVYYWTIAYVPFGLSSLLIPRAALSMFCISLVASRAYDVYYHRKKIRLNDILLPLLFTFSIIIVIPVVLQILGASVTIGL